MNFARRVVTTLREFMLSPKGRNVLTFCAFLLISGVLWMVMTLNVATQRDLQCRLRLLNAPDSVMLVSDMPEYINVSVRAKGTQLLSYMLGRRPKVDIDYRQYARAGEITLSGAELRNISHLALGQGITVSATAPDTLKLLFTSRPAVQLPVAVEASITTKPNCELSGPVRSLTDSVLLYSYRPLPKSIDAVSTQPVRLEGISQSKRMRVKLSVPPGCRAVPDSVTIAIDVEPMIGRELPVVIRPINVPADRHLILLPSKVMVRFLQPMSVVDRVVPRFTVTADYNSLVGSHPNKIKLNISRVEGNVSSVRLSTDSVDYRIEKP